jgi:hypothetical protein
MKVNVQKQQNLVASSDSTAICRNPSDRVEEMMKNCQHPVDADFRFVDRWNWRP